MRYVVCLVCSAVGAAGWSSDSHRVIAAVAGDRMSEKATRYLEEHLGELELGEASVWADQVASSDPDYAWSRALHFSDTPYRDCMSFVEARDCGNGTARCIVTAIANYTQRASDVSLSKLEREEAIKFVLHLVADAHSAVHVAFAEDYGGNSVVLIAPPVSLHDVWDFVLLDSLKVRRGFADSWIPVAHELVAMVGSDEEMAVRGLLDHEQLLRAGEIIVSQTATEVTCESAYRDEGRWIDSGHVLSRAYRTSRAAIMVDQFVKAAVRIAQIFDHIASDFYRNERGAASAAFVVLDDDRFNVAIEFNPEDHLFAPDMYPVRIVSPAIPPLPWVSAAETRRRRILRRRARQNLNRKKIDWVLVRDLVIIKRDRLLYITEKQRVRSAAWVPNSMRPVSVRFGSSADSELILLDSSVFFVATLSQRLMDATFNHLAAQ